MYCIWIEHRESTDILRLQCESNFERLGLSSVYINEQNKNEKEKKMSANKEELNQKTIPDGLIHCYLTSSGFYTLK